MSVWAIKHGQSEWSSSVIDRENKEKRLSCFGPDCYTGLLMLMADIGLCYGLAPRPQLTRNTCSGLATERKFILHKKNQYKQVNISKYYQLNNRNLYQLRLSNKQLNNKHN